MCQSQWEQGARCRNFQILPVPLPPLALALAPSLVPSWVPSSEPSQARLQLQVPWLHQDAHQVSLMKVFPSLI